VALAHSQPDCPDDVELAGFVERTLSAARRDAVAAHVDGCAACRETIAHVVATADDDRRELGRYRLDRELGRGGMGVVWQAWDPALERAVAIKLLVPEAAGEHHAARLLREARALARLQHPNVVAVHDVGEADGEVFIATELVDGETLDTWQRGRPAHEIVHAYAQAARGLAAAHALGLVHRDVKPSNILVGRDGRIRVGDFGLAMRVTEADAGAAAAPPAALAVGTAAPLTEAGEVVGTPAYMAPEQRGGAAVDARADQYSLCLALAEALLGERPAPAPTAAALAARGIAAPWPAIARGLAPRPEDRFADLAPLIAALDGGAARRRRRRVIAGVGAGAIAAAIGAVVVLGRGADPAAACADRRPLAGAWEPATRDAITAGFAATGLAYAGDAATGAITALDRWAADFTAEDRRACEDAATGRQARELARRRAACLDRARGELAALVGALGAAAGAGLDAATVQRAPASARGLPAPSACNTPAGLADQTIPADAATTAAVDALTARLATARTRRRLGKLADARALAEAAVTDAGALGFLPALAAAQHELGTVLHAEGDAAAAERALEDALAVSAQAHTDYRTAALAALLVEVVGAAGDVAAAERQARLAQSAIIRAGGDPWLDAVIERGLGRAHQEAQQYAAAYDRYVRAEAIHTALGRTDDVDFDRRAQVMALGSLDRIDDAARINALVLASDREQLGAHHPKTIADVTAAGILLFRAGRYADAAAQLEAAVALDAVTSGKTSAHYASLASRLAGAYLALGRIEAAEPLLRDAVDVLAATQPPDSQELRGQRMNLAGVLTTLGRYADAAAILHPLIDATRAAEDTETLGLMLQNLAENQARAGDHPEAFGLARDAIAAARQVFGPRSRREAEALVTLGNAEVGLGRAKGAIATYTRAIEMFEAVVGKATAQLGEPLTARAELRLAAGDAAAARADLVAAIEVLAGADPVDLARARFALARVLAAAGDPAAAGIEARAAADLYRGAGARAAARLAAVDAWLLR
jgi:tetratricopeptide (TPR) repeat protein